MTTFKQHSRKDIPLRIKWLNNKNANQYVGDNSNHQTNLEEQTRWFDAYENNPAKKFFTIFCDQTPVGFMGLSKIDSQKGTAESFL